jgi:hypothetical protein
MTAIVANPLKDLVELVGIEPTTSSLRTMLSPAHLACSFNHIEELEAGNGIDLLERICNVRKLGGCASLLWLPFTLPPSATSSVFCAGTGG